MTSINKTYMGDISIFKCFNLYILNLLLQTKNHFLNIIIEIYFLNNIQLGHEKYL